MSVILRDLEQFERDSLLKIFNENRLGRPTVVVLRESFWDAASERLTHLRDDGENNCDTVLLLGQCEERLIALRGRSLPARRYQARMVAGTARANYIASGLYSRAWVRGYHRGHEALVQSQAFTVWRSRDMDLRRHDDDPSDDWSETGIQANNFHGFAPWSAGCLTVVGNMRPPSHDWAIVHEWSWSRHSNQRFFAACFIEPSDWTHWRCAGGSGEAPPTLRLGSIGQRVIHLQTHLNRVSALARQIAVDGQFGPVTHQAVRARQAAIGLDDYGIWEGPVTGEP